MHRARRLESQPMNSRRSTRFNSRQSISDEIQNEFFKALSDPTRRGILLLLRHKPLFVAEIVEHFPLAQPTISRHLAVLHRAGLVTNRREGQFVTYRLARRTLSEGLLGFYREFRERSDELQIVRSDPNDPLKRSSDCHALPLR